MRSNADSRAGALVHTLQIQDLKSLINIEEFFWIRYVLSIAHSDYFSIRRMRYTEHFKSGSSLRNWGESQQWSQFESNDCLVGAILLALTLGSLRQIVRKAAKLTRKLNSLWNIKYISNQIFAKHWWDCRIDWQGSGLVLKSLYSLVPLVSGHVGIQTPLARRDMKRWA